jgi:hypothetical protein
MRFEAIRDAPGLMEIAVERAAVCPASSKVPV